jgi:hypothetical protein
MMPLLLLVDNRIIIQLKTTLCLVVQEQCMRMSHPERYIQVKRTVKVEQIVPDGVVQWEKVLYLQTSHCSTSCWTLICLVGLDVPRAAGTAPTCQPAAFSSGVEWLQDTSCGLIAQTRQHGSLSGCSA